MGKLFRFRVARHVDASAATVWQIVSNHAEMARWTPYRRSVLEAAGTTERDGTGAIRALYLVGPPTRERITEFDPPRRLRYELLSGLPFRDYTGEVTVEPVGDTCKLRTEIAFRTRIPGSHLFGPIAIRLATRSAARLAEKRASGRRL